MTGPLAQRSSSESASTRIPLFLMLEHFNNCCNIEFNAP